MTEIVLSIIGTICGSMGTLIAVQSHIKSLKNDWRNRLEEEINKQNDAKLKAYAAERDFNHLRNNQDQLKQAIGTLQKETDEIREKVIRIEVIQGQLYNQFQNLLELTRHAKP